MGLFTGGLIYQVQICVLKRVGLDMGGLIHGWAYNQEFIMGNENGQYYGK